jgi:hypothetical protein
MLLDSDQSGRNYVDILGFSLLPLLKLVGLNPRFLSDRVMRDDVKILEFKVCLFCCASN